MDATPRASVTDGGAPQAVACGAPFVFAGDGAQSAAYTSRRSCAVSDGVLPTFTPAASRASFFA